MNDAAAAIWGSRISYYTAGQGFYAGESGWAGASGETMNAECRIAVGGVLILRWRRWRVAPAGGDHPTVGRRQDCRRSAAASAHGSQDRIVARLAQAPPEHSIPLCRWPCLHARFCRMSYIVSIALRASLSCQRLVTTKYTDHTTSMTTIQSKTSIDVMLRLSASNTSSATICVARPKSITVSFKESKPHSISTATLREPVKKET